MKKTPKPIVDRIIIIPMETLDKKVGQALVPDTDKQEKKKPSQGKIFAVGPDYKGKLKKGDIVLFEKYGPEYLTFDGVEYAFTSEDTIFATL